MDTAGTSRPRNLWTEEEDTILREEVEKQATQGPVKDWRGIATRLPGRSNKDCRKRWMKLDSSVTKGSWSDQEDELLRRAVDRYSHVWTEVARAVGTRNADQCSKRWLHFLSPDLDLSEWTEEDDARLLAGVEGHGNNWRKIVDEALPGRSTTDAKNRYTILQRSQRNHSSGSVPRARRRRANRSASSSDRSAPGLDVSASGYNVAYVSPDRGNVFERPLTQAEMTSMTAMSTHENLVAPPVDFGFDPSVDYFAGHGDMPDLSEAYIRQMELEGYPMGPFADGMSHTGDTGGGDDGSGADVTDAMHQMDPSTNMRGFPYQ